MQTEKLFLKQPKDSRHPEKPLKVLTLIRNAHSRNVSIRGCILAGTCHSAKMNRTIIIRRNYLHYVKKYQRQAILVGSLYEKRHSNIPAHISPCFRVKEGDHVIIGQCRLLAKTVRFNVLKVIPAGTTSGGSSKKAIAAV
ncbi:unnamed protein product [Musa acuminata subsp. malaccensis]|uniref:(wild Malaysian banana) hypothetical protein n=1 Tax=Musa acuminata subsp. malaccensis TaxID=214687 RepID=A0A804KHH2_MUSAM|nr:unnamed protein product [Musa acuminata subsp. malaccensis]